MQDTILVSLGLPLALAIVMAGMGLSLTPHDFRITPRQRCGVMVGATAHLLGIPAIGFLLGMAAGGGQLGVTMVLCSVLPGGVTSNMFTYLARGNLPLSIILTVISSTVTVFSIPFFINYAYTVFLGEQELLAMPIAKTLYTIVGIVIIPIAIGMLTRRFQPLWAKKIEPMIGKFSVAVLAAIVLAIVYSERAHFWDHLASAWLLTLALALGSIGLGFLAGGLARLPFSDRLTLAIEMTIKNSTLGLTIALTLLGDTQMAIPVAVYGLLMYPIVGLLVLYGRRKIT